MRLLLFIAFITSVHFGFAQDIITKVNGDDIKAKVVEVGVTEIKYKKFEDLNGPTYIIAKSEL